MKFSFVFSQLSSIPDQATRRFLPWPRYRVENGNETVADTGSRTQSPQSSFDRAGDHLNCNHERVVRGHGIKTREEILNPLGARHFFKVVSTSLNPVYGRDEFLPANKSSCSRERRTSSKIRYAELHRGILFARYARMLDVHVRACKNILYYILIVKIYAVSSMIKNTFVSRSIVSLKSVIFRSQTRRY